MVGVSDGIGDNLPRLIPAVAAVVEKNSHQLGNGKGRVGIIDVNCNFVGKIFNRAVNSQVIIDNILN